MHKTHDVVEAILADITDSFADADIAFSRSNNSRNTIIGTWRGRPFIYIRYRLLAIEISHTALRLGLSTTPKRWLVRDSSLDEICEYVHKRFKRIRSRAIGALRHEEVS